jgi:sialate O-acetylesterase
LSHFTIAGEDQKFVPAVATIDGDSVVVHSDQVAKPAAVRFGWRNDAAPNLSNKEGLPASPFRTDQWKGATEP